MFGPGSSKDSEAHRRRWLVQVTLADQRTMTVEELADAWRSGLLNGGVKCRHAGSLVWLSLCEIPEVRTRLERRTSRLPPAPSSPARAHVEVPSSTSSPSEKVRRRGSLPADPLQRTEPTAPNGTPQNIAEALQRCVSPLESKKAPDDLDTGTGAETSGATIRGELGEQPGARLGDPVWPPIDGARSPRSAEQPAPQPTTPRFGVESLDPTPPPVVVALRPQPPVSALEAGTNRTPGDRGDEETSAPSVASELGSLRPDGSLRPIAMSQAPGSPTRSPRWIAPSALAAAAVGLFAIGSAVLGGAFQNPTVGAIPQELVASATRVTDVSLTVTPVAESVASAARASLLGPPRHDTHRVGRTPRGGGHLAGPSPPASPEPESPQPSATPSHQTQATRPPEDHLPEHTGARLAPDPPPFNPAQAVAALNLAAANAGRCGKPEGPSGTGSARVSFDPTTGNVTSTSLAPPFTDTEVGRCVARQFSAARIEPFAGGPVSAKVRFAVPQPGGPFSASSADQL